MLKEHIDVNNLHHAYLIEGENEKIVSELFVFLENIGIQTYGNPNFNYIITDSFKIKEARNIRSQSLEKPISVNFDKVENKKIFVISLSSKFSFKSI